MSYTPIKPERRPDFECTELGLKVSVFSGETIRSGGLNKYYRHDLVFIGDTYIGRVQTRFLGKRVLDTMTSHPTANTCVRGNDLPWLVREYRETVLKERETREDQANTANLFDVQRTLGLLINTKSGRDGVLLNPRDQLKVSSRTDKLVRILQVQAGKPVKEFDMDIETLRLGLSEHWLKAA